MCGNETTAIQLEKKQKRLSNHALKALCFALLILSAYLVQQYTTAFCITHNWRTIILPHCSCAPPHHQCSNRNNAATKLGKCLGLHLMVLSRVGVVHSDCLVQRVLWLRHPRRAAPILAVSLLQPKLEQAVKKYVLYPYDGDISASDQNQQDVDDMDSQHVDHIFELSQVIANSGSLVTAIFGHYMIMAGPVNPGGFLFFWSIGLALYLMMAITVRAVSRPHATCLAIVLMALIFITAITASIQVVVHGPGTRSTPQAAKSSNHRKMLAML